MERGPGELTESVDEMTLRPFWGVSEILGIVAALAPFVITYSSTSFSTENGHLTHYVFRDWIAVGGGVLAALGGLGAATRFGTTMRSKRPLRAAIVIGLLGLGAFQILRGLGVVGAPVVASEAAPDPQNDPAIRAAMANLEKAKPAVPSAPPIDLAGPTKAVFTMWQGNQIHELFGHMAREFQKTTPEEDLAMLLARINAAVGACDPPAAPLAYTLDKDTWTASAKIMCGKSSLKLGLDFQIENTTAMLEGFHLDPDPPAKADVADASRLVKALLADLLAAKLDHFPELLDPRVIKNMGEPATMAAQLAKVARDAGKLGAIREVSSTADNEFQHSFEYDVAGAKHHLTATFTAHFVLARWFVTDFNLAPAEAKKN